MDRGALKSLRFAGARADSAIPPHSSIDYYQAVQKQMGNTNGFYRLFMVSGMNHCGGGPWRSTGSEPWSDGWSRARRQTLTANHPESGDTQSFTPYMP